VIIKYWVYAIQSKTNGRIYIGQTNDLFDRIKRHNAGSVYSTKADTPWKIIALQQFESRATSMKKEAELKKSKGKRTKWIEKHQDHNGFKPLLSL